MPNTAQDIFVRPSFEHLAEAVGRICRDLGVLTHEAGLYRLACLLHEVEVEAEYALEVERELLVN